MRKEILPAMVFVTPVVTQWLHQKELIQWPTALWVDALPLSYILLPSYNKTSTHIDWIISCVEPYVIHQLAKIFHWSHSIQGQCLDSHCLEREREEIKNEWKSNSDWFNVYDYF